MFFRFASPQFFFLLAAVAAAVLYRRRHPAPAMAWSDLSVFPPAGGSFVFKLRRIIPILRYLALVLLIAAAARPQAGTRRINMLTEGINIILAVDLSESMAALDFKSDGRIVNRLEAVRAVVKDFVARRHGDRIGLVVFGTEAYTQLPLTRDYGAISGVIDRLEIGAAGGNTAIGDAIGISLKRMADIPSRSNVIILLTDGQSNSGALSPEAATGIAAERKVKIYTVGVGTRGEAPFLIKHPVLGDQYVHRRVDIDEATLEKIAETTGGRYFRAQKTDELASIYVLIDQLEKTTVEVKAFAEYRELYPYLLLPAFGLLGLWVLLSNTRYLRIP